MALIPMLCAVALASAGTGGQVEEQGFYAAVRGSHVWFPAAYTADGAHAAIEVGHGVGEVLTAGLLLAAGGHDAAHYAVQAEDPAASGPPGDFTLLRAGAVGRARWRMGIVGLGGRAEVAFAHWASPFATQAWRQTVRPLLGDGRHKSGAGLQAGASAEFSLFFGDPGPALVLSFDPGYVLAGDLVGFTTGASLALTTPF
jgi:hypothetical protein